jgi:hypothetical protein
MSFVGKNVYINIMFLYAMSWKVSLSRHWKTGLATAKMF